MNSSREIEVRLKKVCPVVVGLDSMAGYASILDCPDGKIRLYYRGRGRGGETHVRTSNDGITFSRAKVIFNKSCICHNFSPFIHEGKYYAVGGKGKDAGKKPQGRGLYLLHSEDGLSWSLRQESPIITMAHPGYIRAPFGLKAEFDSPISCVPYKGKFYLYFRANVEKGIRTIQYAVSDNLTDWSEIKLVQFTPEFNASLGQNLYGSYFFNFEGRVMGFIPCFWNGGEGFIGLFEPEGDDMGHWSFEGWFNRSPTLSSIKKNHTFPVQGIVRNRSNPEIMQYYVHNNYLTGNPDQPVTIDLYVDEKWAMDPSIQRIKNQYPFIDQHPLFRKLRELPATLRHKLRQLFVS